MRVKLCFVLLAAAGFAQQPVEVAGIAAAPHATSAETRYRGRATPAGAWVQLVLRNRTDRPQPAPAMVNGREPFQWVLAGEWSWFDSPRVIPAGGFAVLSFNGVTAQWRPGAEIALESSWRQWRVSARLPAGELALRKVAFFPARGEVAVHYRNGTAGALRLEQVTLHTGAGFARPVVLEALRQPAEIPAGEHGAALWRAPELPAGHALVELQFSHQLKLWSLLRVKDDSFDIGAGWLDTRAPSGVNPLTVPAFRSLLRRLHINLVHAQSDPAPDGLPFRRMATFADVKKFSRPGEAATIHCADVVGEPQHSGLTPFEVLRRLKPYEAASYPTCLTLSEDPGFGYYAGLSDWPHFDAYRVNAPHADDWAGYERFGGLAWGAPLETIGAMMRVLNDVSRPRPVAAWSQNAHYNWRAAMGGRTRLDPTPGEMAMQAWQAVANGAQSLYWYSLESYSVLRSPDLLVPTMEIGRQIRVLQPWLETGDAIWRRRSGEFDLNVMAAPDAAVLFALHLGYRPDGGSKTFVWDAPGAFAAEFELPFTLRGEGLSVLRLTPQRVEPVSATPTARGVRIAGQADPVAIYIASKENGLIAKAKALLEAAKARETAEAFDLTNAQQLGELAATLGYEGAAR